MTDKDKIKFAIRYLKKGLKSKRTPPLYEELMNELGFEKKDKVNNLASVAEVRLANWQKYSKELKEAKEIIRELVRVEYADFTNGDYSNELSKVLAKAEQFLKEIKEND